MNSDSIDRTLQRARGALTPSSNERAHVLERLSVRFPELASSGGQPIESNLEPWPERLPSSEARTGFWQTIRGTGAAGVSLGAGLVAVGFIAGYTLKAERLPPREPPAMQAVAPVALTASDGSPAPPATERPPPRSERAIEGGEPVGSKDASTPRERRARPPTPRAAPEAAPPDLRQQLEQELLALQRAERALRNDNAELALALLAELDAQHARPLLGEERTATRSMASCQADVPGARAAARTFLESHPRSVYGERIRASCQLETGARNPPGGATDAAPRDIDGR